MADEEREGEGDSTRDIAVPDADNELQDDGATRAAARLDASHELSHAWARSVVDITFVIGSRDVRIDTEYRMEPDRSNAIHTVHGRIGSGAFAFELTQPLFDALAADLPDAVDFDTLSGQDAALLMEHMLTGAMERVEKEIGEPITIDEVEHGPIVTELEPIIAAVSLDKSRHTVRAVFGDPLHMRILTEWLRAFSAGDEFDAGPETRVEIGPIILDGDSYDNLEPGDALVIGTEPGKNLIGRLVRPTGRTVPVAIDTSQVIASGPARQPGWTDETLGPDDVSLGVEIGTVRMTPTNLRRIDAGARFMMERNRDNVCALWLDEEVVARGELTLIEGQLGVEVRSLGDGPMPPKPRPVPVSTTRSRPRIEQAPPSISSEPIETEVFDPDPDATAFDDEEEAEAIENASLPVAPREMAD